MHRRADRGRPIDGGAKIDPSRKERAKPWQRGPDAVDGVDDVGARLDDHGQRHGRLPVRQTRGAHVLYAVPNRAEVAEPCDRAAVRGDNEREVVGRLIKLIVAVDLPACSRIGKLAFRMVRVRLAEDASHVLQRDAVLVQDGGVQLDADRRQRAAADVHLADPVHLRDFLRQHRGRDVVDPAGWQRVRSERQDDRRRVGRVHLAVRGVARQIGWKLPACGIDGRLHITRRGVDVACEIELQDDVGGALSARRRHFGDARDAAELALEGRRHRRGHRFGAGTRKGRIHDDGRVSHLRQRGDREVHERKHAGCRQCQRQQCRRHRSSNERLGDAHSRRPCTRAASRSNAR